MERDYSNNNLLNRSAKALDGGDERSFDNNFLLNRITIALENGGGGGKSAVESVNGQVGNVVLTANDLDAYTKEEADDKFIANDNVKTINGETIIGEGDITVGGSAPYVLGELTPDEDNENVFYLSEEDHRYLENNTPEKILVFGAYVLTNVLGEGLIPNYQAVVYGDGSKLYLTVSGDRFEMVEETTSGLKFQALTQAEYDALDEKDNNTIYFIQ